MKRSPLLLVMPVKKRADIVFRVLEELFPEPKVPLIHHDPFTLLVAVCLSAQCTDERVNKVTELLFKKASTPSQMGKLDLDELVEIIKPCGLSRQKGKRLIEMSQILLLEYDGAVPKTFEKLESLPGVGHKTASVVMSQAFHQPAFAVDTHILRSSFRWGLSKATTPSGVEKDLKRLFSRSTWSKLHLQMILFSREYCQARMHEHSRCPICSKLYSC